MNRRFLAIAFIAVFLILSSLDFSFSNTNIFKQALAETTQSENLNTSPSLNKNKNKNKNENENVNIEVETNTLALELPQDIVVNTPLYTAIFTEKGGRLKSFVLKNYSTDQENGSLSLEMINVDSPDEYPMFLSIEGFDIATSANLHFKAPKNNLTLIKGQNEKIVLVGELPNKVQIERIFNFKADTYLIEQEIIVKNNSSESFISKLGMTINGMPLSKRKQALGTGFGAYINNKRLDKGVKKSNQYLAKQLETNLPNPNVSWIGFVDQYFINVLVLSGNKNFNLGTQSIKNRGLITTATSPTINLAAGQSSSGFNFSFYYGPKDREHLQAAGHNLSQSINFGWFNILTVPLYWLLNALYKIVGNYGIAIIIVTIIIKILFWPLTNKSYRSMKQMQKLQPEIEKLRAKHGTNKEAMSREMMQLYRTYKVNPVGGCLPMVIQIPVFIALYRLLSSSLELRHAPFMLWITDLSAPDRLFNFNLSFNVPLFDAPYGIPVLTLLMGASMILQQKMAPTPMSDPIQAKMMMMLPVFFTFIFINFPSGLVLYWLVNNLLSIGQQILVNRKKN